MQKVDPEVLKAFESLMEAFDEAIEPLSDNQTVKLFEELLEELGTRKQDLADEIEADAEEEEDELDAGGSDGDDDE